jgi:hypothetical protein
MSRTFANLTPAMLEEMGIHSARQLGQPREEVFPTTGSNTYQGQVTTVIMHIRIGPDDGSLPTQCLPIYPGTPITVTLDPTRPTWAYIQVPGGPRGWVGKQHVTSFPVPVPALSIAVHPTNVIALVPIMYTHTLPSTTSQRKVCIIPQGSGLFVTAMTSCRQWV